MGWPTITDVEIGQGISLPDVRASVSATLFAKFRDRDRRLCALLPVPTSFSKLHTGSNFDWTTVHTIRIKPPTNLRGDNGSVIRIETECTLLNNAGMFSSYTQNAMFRLKVVGYETLYSSEAGLLLPRTTAPTNPATLSQYVDMAVSGFWMHPHASGPTVVSVEFQVKMASNVLDVPPVQPSARIAVSRSRGAVIYIAPEPE